jgi:hypothetical protein
VGALVALWLQLRPAGPTGRFEPATAELEPGWTKLPPPPEIREGAALVWAGDELLAWGGCDASIHESCGRTREGYVFDPATSRWSSMPAAPNPGGYSQGVWIDREAVFFPDPTPNGVPPVAYEPASQTWRTLPEAPLDNLRALVWTGAELLAWDGARIEPAGEAAAYDVASNSWRTLPNPPVQLSDVSAAWTGQETVFFGSLLDARNRAATTTARGVAYSAATNTWRELPHSELSPQASSIAFAGDEIVAWDYEVHSQTYDPALDEWSRPTKMPLDFSECYPSSEAIDDFVFAFFCGRAALFDTSKSSWRAVRGGPFREKVKGLGLWQTASMASSGDAVYLLMEGITFTRKNEPCYGCPGSPESMWVFRPAA